MKNSVCRECGMTLEKPDEFHPIEFCILVKAGYNPLSLVERLEKQWQKKQKAVKQ